MLCSPSCFRCSLLMLCHDCFSVYYCLKLLGFVFSRLGFFGCSRLLLFYVRFASVVLFLARVVVHLGLFGFVVCVVCSSRLFSGCCFLDVFFTCVCYRWYLFCLFCVVLSSCLSDVACLMLFG